MAEPVCPQEHVSDDLFLLEQWHVTVGMEVVACMAGFSINRKNEIAIVETHDIEFKEGEGFRGIACVKRATGYVAQLKGESNGGPDIVEPMEEDVKNSHVLVAAEYVINISKPQGRPELPRNIVH